MTLRGAPPERQTNASRQSLLFIESSRGLGGSTVSLCNLLSHLDLQTYRPVVAFSEPEQQQYFLQLCHGPISTKVIRRKKGRVLSAATRNISLPLGMPVPWIKKLLLSAFSVFNHLVVTLPYVLRLYAFAKEHNVCGIHQNNGFDLAAILTARLLRIPLIAYQRGDEWNSPAVRYFARFVELFIANSHATARSLLALGIEPERIVVIYPPVDSSRFAPEVSCATQQLEFSITGSELCFGIIGSLRERKGHRVFLRAAARVMRALPQSRAFIVGEAAPADLPYKQDLILLARELGIEDRVVFTGFRTDVSELIQFLHVVVHASVKPEPFGRVIIEAMAMRKPVIASMAGGPLEIITNGRNGFLVPPDDDEQLADHIIKLLTDSALAARIGEQGYLEVKGRFSVSLHVQMMQELYGRVLNHPPRRSSWISPFPGRETARGQSACPGKDCILDLPEHVKRASEFLAREGCRLLGVNGPFQTSVVRVEPRTDSTIYVLRLTAGGEERRFYLKILHSTPAARGEQVGSVAAEYRILLHLWECFAPFANLGVVKPVTWMPQDLSLLTEEFAGQKLDAVLTQALRFPSRRSIEHAGHLCRLTGEWLRRFQSFSAPGDISYFDVSELFAYCDERVRIIYDSPDGGFDRHDSIAITRHLEKLASEIGHADLSLTGRHNDFRPDNILTDGTRIVVLDFSGFTYGPRLYDFMKFWMKLEDLTSGPFGRKRACAEVQQAFLEGYGLRVDLSSPLVRLLRMAFALDKISEAVDGELPRTRLSRRLLMNRWYRAQRQWLRQAIDGKAPRC